MMNDDINDGFYEDNSPESYPEELGDINEEQQIAYAQKMFEAYTTFSSHFSTYIKQNDKELWQRAVDYAMTFTQEDVSGIRLYYEDEEKKNEED